MQSCMQLNQQTKHSCSYLWCVRTYVVLLCEANCLTVQYNCARNMHTYTYIPCQHNWNDYPCFQVLKYHDLKQYNYSQSTCFIVSTTQTIKFMNIYNYISYVLCSLEFSWNQYRAYKIRFSQCLSTSQVDFHKAFHIVKLYIRTYIGTYSMNTVSQKVLSSTYIHRKLRMWQVRPETHHPGNF